MNPAADPADEDFSAPASEQKSKYIVADGTYPAKCVNVEKKTSKAGSPMLVFEYLGTGGEAVGKEFKDYTLYDVQADGTLRAGWKMVKRMKAFGISKGEDGVLPIRKADIVGKSVTLKLAVQTFGEGKQSMSVEDVTPPTEGTSSPLPL